ncbi:hypothetical protein Pst134EB_016332 [Puccinia striiformis f. sp. tritici]|nr:hypothetical protein Pst134EB_016332 [Puccinia striiformis f. sp. tritici]
MGYSVSMKWVTYQFLGLVALITASPIDELPGQLCKPSTHMHTTSSDDPTPCGVRNELRQSNPISVRDFFQPLGNLTPIFKKQTDGFTTEDLLSGWGGKPAESSISRQACSSKGIAEQQAATGLFHRAQKIQLIQNSDSVNPQSSQASATAISRYRNLNTDSRSCSGSKRKLPDTSTASHFPLTPDQKQRRFDQGTEEHSFPGSLPSRPSLHMSDHLVGHLPKSRPLYSFGNHENNLIHPGGSGFTFGRVQHELCTSESNKDTPSGITGINKTPTDITGIATKIGLKRIEFNRSIINPQSLPESQQHYIMAILESLPKPRRGEFVLQKPYLKLVCQLLRQQHTELDVVGIEVKMKQYKKYIDTWQKYLIVNMNLSWDKLDDKFIVTGMPEVFPVYLSYVLMFISIMPFKEDEKYNEDLDYTEIFKEAMELFQEFNQFLKKTYHPISEVTDQIWIEKRKVISKSTRSLKSQAMINLWHFLELWLRRHHKTIWDNLTFADGSKLNRSAKKIFNFIFVHGSDGITRQIEISLKIGH